MNRLVTKNRLLSLATFLETLKREEFDFNLIRQEGDVCQRERGCGTVACAMGWMPNIRNFRRIGVGLTNLDINGNRNITFRGHEGYNAAREVFGIGHDSIFLFGPGTSGLGSNATPKRVAKHIRKYVKNGLKRYDRPYVPEPA